MPLAIGAFVSLALARVVDSAPVDVGGRSVTWPFVAPLVMIMFLPFFGAAAGTRWERLTDWLLATLFALPFWLIAAGAVFDMWNRKRDTSEGQWMTASISMREPARRSYHLHGRLEQGTALEVDFNTLQNVKPGDRVWIKVHPGALGRPWGSAWRAAASD
jgi:hypothetical protein